MTPLVRWMRRVRDKFFGRFYEGPDMPARFTEAVIVFANTHPTATREQWTIFAQEHARAAYMSAFIRGVEYVERDVRASWGNPDAVMDTYDPDWRWSPGVELEDPLQVVPEYLPTVPEQQERLIDQFRRRRSE
jgi:hypothetical protein